MGGAGALRSRARGGTRVARVGGQAGLDQGGGIVKRLNDWLNGLPPWLAALLVVGGAWIYCCLFPALVEGW